MVRPPFLGFLTVVLRGLSSVFAWRERTLVPVHHLVRATILSDLGSTLMSSFNLSHLLKVLSPNIVISGARTSIYEFAGGGGGT